MNPDNILHRYINCLNTTSETLINLISKMFDCGHILIKFILTRININYLEINLNTLTRLLIGMKRIE